MQTIKGYKATEQDLTCRGFQYEIGKTYKMDGYIELCERGFHFCEKIDAMMEPPFSPEVNEHAMSLLAEMEAVLLSPQKDTGKGGDPPWPPPASGLSKTG